MPGKSARLVLLLGAAAAILFLVARHARPSPLRGLWRDQSPAALLYEFRDDGSVWLVREDMTLPVFRFAVERGVVEFHDGMGRPRALRFTLDGDRLTLREMDAPFAVVDEYRREPAQNGP